MGMYKVNEILDDFEKGVYATLSGDILYIRHGMLTEYEIKVSAQECRPAMPLSGSLPKDMVLRLCTALKEPEQDIGSPVYTFDDLGVRLEHARKIGYPNITYEGKIQYENTHYLNKYDAWKKCLVNNKAGFKMSFRSFINEFSECFKCGKLSLSYLFSLIYSLFFGMIVRRSSEYNNR